MTRAVSYDAIFEVISLASAGVSDARIVVDDDADLDDPITRLGLALNLLLDEFQSRREQADEALRRRDEMISIAAHEMYTPLTSLTLVLEAVRQGVLGSEPERLQHYLGLAQRQTRKLAGQVDALLSVGRSQSNAPMALRLEQIDLAMTARGVAELLTPDLQRSASVLSIHADEPVVGCWDRNRIEQVLTNLVGNAIKFGEGSPIEITISVHEGRACVAVVDYGIGVPTDRMDRIFERFERGVSSTRYSGLGLGLSIVREIVSAHGGSVQAESAVGEGTTFLVELPCSGPALHDEVA